MHTLLAESFLCLSLFCLVCLRSKTTFRKGNGLSPISNEAVRLPLAKYEERHAIVRVCLCISIVANETLTFRLTIALQRFVLSIGIGLRRPKRRENYIIKPPRTDAAVLCFVHQRLRRFVRRDLTGESFSRLRQ